MKRQNRQIHLHVFALLLALIWIGTIAGFPRANNKVLAAATLPPEDLSPTTATPQLVITPATTEIITLPLVEQNSGDGIPSPVVESLTLQETPVPEVPEPTPTPTILPPQTGTANLPIVVGAAVIFSIIIMAWLLVGWRPKRPQDF